MVWTSASVPAIARVMGFDPEGGTAAMVDTRGDPARLDLRLGSAGATRGAKLASLTAPQGTDIYGLDPKGSVIRLAPSGSWRFTPPFGARMVFPQRDGTIVVGGVKNGETTLWRVRPPDLRVLDSTIVPAGARAARTQAGDRIYFGTDSAVVGVRARDLAILPAVRTRDRVTALAATPSGDRVYLTTASRNGISILNRYTDRLEGRIELPGAVDELRMDPLGRYMAARPARGDSAWFIAVATDRLVGAAHTLWTSDLPAFAPDGSVATTTGRDVVLLDAETLQPVRTVVGGGRDLWYFLFWNGFRPRAAALDEPVAVAAVDSASAPAVADSLVGDSATPRPPDASPPAAAPVTAPVAASSAPPAASALPQPPAGPSPRPPGGFTVSFATLLSEEKAIEAAARITVEGTRARVVSANRAGTAIYRVVLGPYPTRADAERIGRAAGQQFWVFEGAP